MSVLACRAAQDPAAPTMGMTFTVLLDSAGVLRELRWHKVDTEQVAVAAMLARPFSLKGETVHGAKVAASLRQFASTSEQVLMCEQLRRIWQMLPLKRMKTFKAYADGTQILPREGVWNSDVADRVLYSQMVHADDARALLDHIDTEEQQWSLAGLVGDWLATIAHQQALLHWICPGVCASATPWAGTPMTIVDRLGVAPGSGIGQNEVDQFTD